MHLLPLPRPVPIRLQLLQSERGLPSVTLQGLLKIQLWPWAVSLATLVLRLLTSWTEQLLASLAP